jgi:hypothetical protein
LRGSAGAVAWPLRARAQWPVIPTVGYLKFDFFRAGGPTPFRQALYEADYIEGRDVRIEVRSAV